MSNLNLPNMHPVALKRFLNGKSSKTLAYATTVHVLTDSDGRITYSIRHHGNEIAVIGDYSLSVSNCGWSSPTTSNRISRILRDNDIPYYVAVRQGFHSLFKRGADKHERITDSFYSAYFVMRAGLWTLADS